MAGLANILTAIQHTNKSISEEIAGKRSRLDLNLELFIVQGQHVLDYLKNSTLSPTEKQKLLDQIQQFDKQKDDIYNHILQISRNKSIKSNFTSENFEKVTALFKKIAYILDPKQLSEEKEHVLEIINALDDSNKASNKTTNIERVTKIDEAIKAVKGFLESDTNVVNKGLLEYLNQRYMFQGIAFKSFFGEMATKHKPVLKFLVDLAGLSLEDFAEKIKKPTTMFNKVEKPNKLDVSVRFDILTAVSAVAAVAAKEQKTILKSPFEELEKQLRIQQTQEGGHYTMRKNRMGCGCGVKFAGGSRRTLKKVKAVKQKNKQKTVKQKQKQKQKR